MDYEELANEKMEFGLYEEAVEILNEAIELKPREGEYYFLRGEAKHCLEKYEDAIIDYDTAIELYQMALAESDKAELYNNMGLCYYHLKQPKKAVEFF